MKSGNDYSYTDAGFDSFLSRSIDNVAQYNLDSTGPMVNQVRYDGMQVSGMLGDTLQIGNIHLDGVTGRISIYDSGEEVVRIGELGE